MKVFLSWLLSCCVLWVTGQHTPPMHNFRVSDYKAHQQNWSACQGKDGKWYFANTEGLLEYNGNSWALYKIPSGKIIRSVCGSGDRIFTGAFGEIGFWEKDICGKLYYQSLADKIPHGLIDKEEIWHILEVNGKIFFQSFSVLLVYDGINMQHIRLPGSIMFLHAVDGRLLIQCIDFGIYEISEGNTITRLKGSEFFKGKTVTGISKFPDDPSLIITTGSHGVFTYLNGSIRDWNPALTKYFSEIQINRSLISSGGDLVLGSIRDGVMIFNRSGQLKYHFNTSNGLQNNTVLAIFEDRGHHLWLGLDKGITHVEVNDDFLLFNDHIGALGNVYAMIIQDSILYLGTNQGLYYSDQRNNKNPERHTVFQLVTGTQGQVWELKLVQNQILCGHNEGTFIIDKTKARKISDVTGGWFMERVPGLPQLLLQGTYTGLVILEYKNGQWVFRNKIKGYQEPVKKILLDQGQIWVSGPNTGLSRLKCDAMYNEVIYTKNYREKDGLLHPHNLDINHMWYGITVNDGQNYYRYDNNQDKFIQDSLLHTFQPGFLVRASVDHYWFRVYKHRIILMHDKEEISGFNLSANKDYHNIYYNQDLKRNLICLNEGYAITGIGKPSKQADLGTVFCDHIISIRSGKCYPVTNNRPPEIAYSDNDIKVEFYDFKIGSDKSYKYRLLPSFKDWRETNDPSSLSLSNLSPGQYTLQIKSHEHKPSVYTFLVLPPWYQSHVARLMYLFLMIIAIYLMKRYFDRKLMAEKRKLEVENQRLLRERMYQIENDRLHHENIHKSKELANATIHLIQKNELLQEIKDELIDVRKTGDHRLTTKDFQNLMKLINTNMTVEDDKNLFESNFNEVHDVFLKKLKSAFPELSPADLKLAAYIKMNLTTKEIAPLFNISMRGLENKRYRLRKKMQLTNDANIAEFLQRFE